jgi:membrane-associated PAP2 superfamily phosphatase
VLLALVAATLRPWTEGPSRAERWGTLAAVGVGLLLVPLLKRVSATSCPWDLAEFGGHALYVPHWRLGVSDGGPGHCFPSGHAVSAFAFLPLVTLWRRHRPAWARAWLVGILVSGAAFGTAQWLRGAHFPSHTLWSAWLCWVVALLSGWWLQRQVAEVPARAAAARAAAPRPAPAAARRGRRGAARQFAGRSGRRRACARSPR